jgi:hypothetical protein
MTYFGNGADNKAKQVINCLLANTMHQKISTVFGKNLQKQVSHGMPITYQLKRV